MPDISIVIPAYRAAGRIGTAIASVVAQPGIECDIVVVIDDQCRETETIARSFGDRVDIVWNETNLGPGRSRNAGLARVRAPLVMFLDSDDWLEGPVLAGLQRAMDDCDADIGFSTFVNVNETTGSREPVPPPSALTAEQLFREWMIGTAYVPPCGVVWRTERLRAIGGWDRQIRRGDDAELACRALLLGFRFATSVQGAGIYLYHESPYRVSRQASRCGDLLAIIDKLTVLDSAVFPRSVIKTTSAQAYYETARIAFLDGQPEVGRRALEKSRALGFHGHRGNFAARLLGGLVGLENRLRLRAWLAP